MFHINRHKDSIRQLFPSAVIAAALALSACSHDGDDSTEEQNKVPEKPMVTMMTTINGLGDNGYNDSMLEGLFMFHEASGVEVALLHPKDMEEAELMYNRWMLSNALSDSAVLIIGSSAYEQMISSSAPSLKGKGSRLLLLESREEIPGVSTVCINRYGASYMAGALLGAYPAYILAAMPHMEILETAIQGFKDGHKSQQQGAGATMAQEYLADGEEGFAMPDSAYHVMARHIEQVTSQGSGIHDSFYSEAVFPLLGGSLAGALHAFDDNRVGVGVIVGMDRNRNSLSTSIPFSLVVDVDSVIADYLVQWRQGLPWPATKMLGLKEGTTDIVFNMDYIPKSSKALQGNGIKDIKDLAGKYQSLKAEAIIKEEEYVYK